MLARTRAAGGDRAGARAAIDAAIDARGEGAPAALRERFEAIRREIDGNGR